MKLTDQQLAAAAGCRVDRAAKWLPYINAAMARFDIVGPNECASFIAQIAHESGHLSRLDENLNYSADGLAATWPSRYRDQITKKPNRLANLLHRKPMAIANNCYANRMGNGPEDSGDGWKYRGRGLIQITGRRMYLLCGMGLELDLLANPDLLLDFEYAALSAAWYWHNSGLDEFDDDECVLAETRIINGGVNGLADRQKLFKKAFAALKG